MKKKKIPRVAFDRTKMQYALRALESGPVILTNAVQLTDEVRESVTKLREYLHAHSEKPLDDWRQMMLSYEFEDIPPRVIAEDPQEDPNLRYHATLRNALADPAIEILQQSRYRGSRFQEQVYTNMAAPGVQIPCSSHIDSRVVFSALALVTEPGTCFEKHKKPQMELSDVLIIRGEDFPKGFTGKPDRHWVQGPFNKVRYSHALSFVYL